MIHNVVIIHKYVNTMSQDVVLGISGSVAQADLAAIREAGRLGEYAVVYRIERTHQGGGYGDQSRHPYAWAVAVYIDTELIRVYNARGAGREWNSLDRLSTWLREQGFWYWWTRNDLEPLGAANTDEEMDSHEQTEGHNPLFPSPESLPE
jgi:hypothetical protein